MRPKDFLYYQRDEKLAIILLLVLIVLTLVLNGVLSQRNNHEIIFTQNDSLVQAFEEFQQSLRIKEEADFTEKNRDTRLEAGRDYRSDYAKNSSASPSADNYVPFPKAEKLAAGETISLNETDTSEWKKVPGIGSSFASRIVKYRNLLGGFVSMEQLREIYGIDNEMISRISPYIKVDVDVNFRKIQINKQNFKELLRHPYLNYKQVQVIMNLRKKKGRIESVNELGMFDEFTADDLDRLHNYLEF